MVLGVSRKIPAKVAGTAIIVGGGLYPSALFSRHTARQIPEVVALLHPGCHQGPNKTAFNRYPEIFAAAAALLPTRAERSLVRMFDRRGVPNA